MLSREREQVRLIDGQRRAFLRKAVVPILRDNAEKTLGAGCLFSHEDRLFLVTAHHVAIDAGPPNEMSIPVSPDDQRLLTLGPAAFISAAEVDTTVARLSLETGERLRKSGWRILSKDDVPESVFADPYHYVYAYPASRVRQENDRAADYTLLRGEPIAFTSKLSKPPEPGPQSNAMGATDWDLYLEWPESIYDGWPPSREKTLVGISGCPIWVQQTKRLYNPDNDLLLAGIQHSVMDGVYVRGTHWSAVMDLIETAHQRFAADQT